MLTQPHDSQDMPAPVPQGGQEQVVSRTAPDLTESRKALVKEILTTIKDDKTYWEKNYKKMRKWMRFARGMQWEQAEALDNVEITDDDSDKKYVANIVQRHIQQEVAALYAKNPTVIAKRAERMDFAIWDGKMSTIATALQAVQSGMVDPLNPAGSPVGLQAMMLQQDIAQGVSRRTMLDRVAKTLQILYSYNQQQHLPNFKRMMKQLVRRTKVCGVGYVKLGYQRALQHSIDTMRNIQDITNQLAEMQRLAADIADGEKNEDSADAEKLKLALSELQKKKEIVVYEGLTWNFPRATGIIPDMNTIQLNGFVGSDHLSEEFIMSAKRIQRVYGIDITAKSKDVAAEDQREYRIIRPKKRKVKDDEYLVYIFWDKLTGLEYHVCDGYADFLQEPTCPYPQLERFFPLFVLTFNDVEDENDIFPLSDVELMRHMQVERNEAREGLSQHRKHAKPLYVSRIPLEDEDKAKLRNRTAFEIIVLNATNSQQTINDIIQQFENAPIDPNLYSTDHLDGDMQLTVGADAAGMGVAGAPGDATATESTIAEGARTKSTSSNVDDLDDLLTEMAREGGQVLLMECTTQTVTKIVGPGAVWPELSRAEIAQEIYLTVEAGSSGRPNRAQDLANFERAVPLLLQMPGINGESLSRYGIKILDERIDTEEMITDGLPSIVAQNAMASKPQIEQAGQQGAGGRPQPSTGDPATDPAQQGAQGANNAPVPQQTQPGPQAPMQRVKYGQDGSRMTS